MSFGPVVGVLALQGAVDPHLETFARLGVTARAVRTRAALHGVTHLVLPGGESTTIHHLLRLFDLERPLVHAWREGRVALFGVCAGAILLGRASAEPPPRLGLLDVAVTRNAYGRQAASFTGPLVIDGLGGRRIDATFIRAPRLAEPGPGVAVLARLHGEPVLVEAPGILAATFHPELGSETFIHRHFLECEPRAATRAKAGRIDDQETLQSTVAPESQPR